MNRIERLCVKAAACIGLLLGFAGATPAQTADRGPAAVRLDQVGAGELLWRSERGLVPLPVVDLTAELTVSGIMVRGRITQRFDNPTAEVIEVVYAYPLPDGAAVDHMELRVGDRRIVSEIREREAARETYEQARSSGRKAALVDQHAGNLFRTSAANINPGERVTVVLEYLQRVGYRDDGFDLRLPLTYTRRFSPEEPAAAEGTLAASHRRPATPEAPTGPVRTDPPRATIRVTLRPGLPLGEVRSESHPIRVTRAGDAHEVTTRPGEIPADRDFLLSWKPALGEQPRTAVLVEPGEHGAHALVLMVPPIPDSEIGLGLPTETLFIVDVSGSMAGPSILQARQALLAALDRLRPEDRFNLLAFNDSNSAFSPAFEHAEGAALARARSWVLSLRASGGTMIHPALLEGLAMMDGSRPGRAQRIVFLTDGAVSNEEELLGAVVRELGERRLHTIGVGQAPNGYLMRKLARFGRGLCEFVSSTEGADNRIDRFFARLDRPVMTDVTLRWEGVDASEVYPERLPDLHAGQSLVLSARLAGAAPRGRLRVSGYSRAGWLEQVVEFDPSSPRGSGVATRWARAKVAALMDGLHEGADPEAVRREVVDLALEFRLVTRYTSLVAVEDLPSALDASRPVTVAAALPQGGTGHGLRLLVGLVLTAMGLLLALPYLHLRQATRRGLP